jgi:translation initiation factor 6
MTDNHILQTNVHGNPNIGLYGYCTEEYCILGLDVSKEKAKKIETILKVPVHRMNIAGTSLVGAFLAGNSTCLLVPNIIFEEELKQLKELKINYYVVESKLTALGNNIVCNNHGCLVNPEYSAEIKKRIREALNVPLKPGTIASSETVGSCALTIKDKGVCHRDITDEEKSVVEELLNISLEPGTVNFGNPYIRSGLLANTNGFIVGSLSSGPELTFVDESLGFLK